MIGYEDNTFRPLRFISRAEALVTIDRALDKVVEEPSTVAVQETRIQHQHQWLHRQLYPIILMV